VSEITAVEAQQMRELLARFDSQHKPMEIHDLNKPPQAPYRFQKFPMTVYLHSESEAARDETQQARSGLGIVDVHIPARMVSRIVHSEEELARALADGWSDKAPEFREDDSQEAELSPRDQREMKALQEQLDASKRRGGRPRKEQAA
jgi:hypothetical protein